MSEASCGLHTSSQRRKVTPLVRLENEALFVRIAERIKAAGPQANIYVEAFTAAIVAFRDHRVLNRLITDDPALAPGTEIPYPGLPEPHSQLAVPMVAAGRVLGVLFAESPRDMAFDFEDEDLLVALAGHLGAAIDLLQAAPEAGEAAAPDAAQVPVPSGATVRVRRYASNDSIFINDDYLIKGVAGAIFWKLLRDYTQAGRTEFSNRELRLDPSIRLPDVADNLEARLLLLQRRLQENNPPMRIEKTGRGRFRLCVACPVLLEEQPG